MIGLHKRNAITASILFLLVSCMGQVGDNFSSENLLISFEKITYYTPVNEAYKTRLSYYFDNGLPSRWIEYDSTGMLLTDYYYEYDNNWSQTGARYIEPDDIEYSYEKVSFQNDSTQLTEWFDSLGNVSYQMVDNLNKDGKTFRATFIGDTIHGYDSTFYTEDGNVERIFFTNIKGKVYNDRSFKYDSINEKGDWIKRRKIMGDTLNEYQIREIYYNDYFTSYDGKYYEGIVSVPDHGENCISFTEDGSTLFITRSNDWIYQQGFIGNKKDGLFTELDPVPQLDSIYNGSISGDGDRIIYSVREGEDEGIWLIEKEEDSWTKKTNLTSNSNIKGGYFNWLKNNRLSFYIPDNNGDIVIAEVSNYTLTILDSLDQLNTSGTEFSPFVDPEENFIIFTRYQEGDLRNQGFFYSTNENGTWTKPVKIEELPYGWGSFIHNDQFFYTDGNNIYSVSVKDLNLKI